MQTIDATMDYQWRVSPLQGFGEPGYTLRLFRPAVSVPGHHCMQGVVHIGADGHLLAVSGQMDDADVLGQLTAAINWVQAALRP